MYNEGDTVRIQHKIVAKHPASWPGIQNEKLPEGSLGSIVVAYGAYGSLDSDYEVEFLAEDGSTRGLLTLNGADLELVSAAAESGTGRLDDRVPRIE